MGRTEPTRSLKRLRIALVLLALAAQHFLARASLAEDPKLVAETPPRSPEEERKLFHLPPGFEIQLVAAEPDIQKPMNIAFDDRSRIWVTNSVEYPFPAKPDAAPRDSIKILEDTDGDGRADSVKTFAEGMNIPIGILPLSGTNGCVAYSIPSIYRFTDRDGDDRADTRDVLYSGFGFADTHGMSSSYTWGFDGWIYATHGFANNSEVKGSDGHVVRMNSGNTYRFRPDGSRIEQWTWGQVNPFGLTFDPFGNLYSADCHSRPIMMLLRGAYYQSFGKPHDGLGFGPEICTHEHGSTGIAGIVYYTASQFPSEYLGTVFTGNPVTNRINHDRFEHHGSTNVAVHQPDFLSCDDPWFRPVDLKAGPDGAIYVADFYNRIIGHYEVPLTHPGRDHEHGRIWRIVYRGDDNAPPRESPRNRQSATLDALIEDLANQNIVVRTQATNQIVERIGRDAAEPLKHLLLTGMNPPIRRVHAMWALERLGALDDEVMDSLLESRDRLVRVHLQLLLGERRELSPAQRTKAEAEVTQVTTDPPFVRRAAVGTLGRHPALENIRPLLTLRRRASADDTQLIHAIRIALREQLRPDPAFQGIPELALDAEDTKNLADVVPGVPSVAAAEWLCDYMVSRPEDAANFTRYLAHATRYLPPERLPQLLAFVRDSCGDDLRKRATTALVLNESMQSRNLKPPGDTVAWCAETARRLIETDDTDSAREAIRLARSMKLDSLAEPVSQIAAGQSRFGSLRADAISMLADVQPERSRELFSAILGNPAEPLPLRQHVAATLGQQQRPEVQAELVRHLRIAPEELAAHIAAALAGSPAGAEKLLDEIAAGKVSARLLQHPLVNARLRSARLPDVQQRISRLTDGLPPAEERLQQTIQTRRAGYAKANPDRDRGAKLFEKHCANCHSLAGRGAKIGPQLDGIGIRGLDRLLEDVLDPNRNVDQAFRSSMIALKSGRILTGLVVNSDEQLVKIADAQGQESQVPKSDIEEQTISKLSPMPANVVDLLPEAEFYDLVAFLLSQREPPAQP